MNQSCDSFVKTANYRLGKSMFMIKIRDRAINNNNGCAIYTDIMTGEKMSLIQIANMELVYW